MGLILGQAVFPAVFVALLLQAVLFGFGGLVVLGANTVVMGVPALAVHAVFGRAIRVATGRGRVAVVSFMAGTLAVMTGAGIAGLMLWMTDADFAGAVKLLLAANVPVAVLEGVVTAFLVMWLKKSAPEFLS